MNNWVSADDPPAGTLATVNAPPPAVYVDTGGAWANVGVATKEGTSGRDRAVGLVWRALPILGLELGGSIAIMGAVALLVDVGPGWFVVGTLGILALAGLGSYGLLDGREWAHSSAGVERHRIDAAADVALAQIDADRETRLAVVRGYLELAERQAQRHALTDQGDRGPR